MDLRTDEHCLYTRKLQLNKQDHHDPLGLLNKISSSPVVPKALAMVNYSSESSLKAEQQSNVR